MVDYTCRGEKMVPYKTDAKDGEENSPRSSVVENLSLGGERHAR